MKQGRGKLQSREEPPWAAANMFCRQDACLCQKFCASCRCSFLIWNDMWTSSLEGLLICIWCPGVILGWWSWWWRSSGLLSSSVTGPIHLFSGSRCNEALGEPVYKLKKTEGTGISEFRTFLHPLYGPGQGCRPLRTWLSLSVMAPFAHGVKIRNGVSPAAGLMDSWVGAEVISVISHRDLGHLHFCRLDRKGLPSGFPSVFSLHGVQHHTNWTGTEGSPISRNKAWKRFNIMQAGWWSICDCIRPQGHQVWGSTDTHGNSIPQKWACGPTANFGSILVLWHWPLK